MTLYTVAKRFLGLKEGTGGISNALIVAMLDLVLPTVVSDQVAWCSAFVNFVCWLCGYERSHSLAARSWLGVGQSVALADAQPGDVVVLKRGLGPQPGPEVLDAPGHVAFLDHLDGDRVALLGGNQGNAVSIIEEPTANVLGVRRLHPVAT